MDVDVERRVWVGGIVWYRYQYQNRLCRWTRKVVVEGRGPV